MSSRDWTINNWLKRVGQDSLAGLEHGRSSDYTPSPYLLEDTPLQSALLKEYSFKTLSEKQATISICQLVKLIARHEDFEYWMTQIFDEARHTASFRQHLITLGMATSATVDQLVEEVNQSAWQQIITPLQSFWDEYVGEHGSYACGVAIVSIVLEGVLAPSAELGERKWLPFDRGAAQIQHFANIDEIRHLAVCADIVRREINASDQTRKEVSACVREGLQLWERLPVAEMMFEREQDYQAGMRQFPDLVQDYYLDDGLPLLNSTPEQRIELAIKWSKELQYARMADIGLTVD